MATKRTKAEERYWLMKSEPSTYGIDDLQRDGKTTWDGVRNYQARNLMRDEMSVGDKVFFYHSSTDPTGIAGIARVCRSAFPDPTQFDPKSKYYDADSSPDEPRWYLVELEFVTKFTEVLPLARLREQIELEGMPLLRRGQRLSVQPVGADHWRFILGLRG